MPTQYHAVADIAPDASISRSHKKISSKNHLGIQYEWLAGFCKQNRISSFQMCIHWIDPIKGFAEPMRGSVHYHIPKKHGSTDEYALFRYFTFPIINLPKAEMDVISRKHGWSEIMEMTWFCHNPTAEGEPCGDCSPCRYAIDNDMGWRVDPEKFKRK